MIQTTRSRRRRAVRRAGRVASLIGLGVPLLVVLVAAALSIGFGAALLLSSIFYDLSH